MITEDILEWVATLPKWQQKLSYVLVEKKKVTEEELEEIYEIFKVEMSLTEGESGVNYFGKVGSELLKKFFLMMQFSDITLVYRHKGLRKSRLLKICIQS